MKYFLYARKSEEDKNRQVQSIQDQSRELRQRYPNLEIADTFEEARTAKQPGRPLFDDMVARIQAGEAQGILVWNISRLVRNPIDQGTIQWMLQKRQLLALQTMDKEHTPEDNVLILNVESGVANQFIIDLTKGTLRGLNSKVEKGWFPHRAPEGYLNDTTKEQGERDILVDPARFPLLRRAWERMLTGGYSVPQIHRELTKMGYRSKPHAKARHDSLSRSALYRIFNSKFYAGYFLHNGEWHRGKHTPMVSEAEFNEVQRILGKPERIQPQKHVFAYAGMIRCGSCGCQIVGEVRQVKLKSGSINTHTYYHCSNSKGICNARVVTENYLEEEIERVLPDVTIRPQYRPLLLAIWRRYYEESQGQDERIYEQQQQVILARRKERDNLLSLRLQELIDNDMFRQKKAELDADIKRLEGDLNETAGVLDSAFEVTENVLLFATEPKERFRELSREDKRTLALHLGARYTLTDRKLALELSPLLLPVQQNARAFEADIATFERTHFRSESNKKAAFDRLVSVWGPAWNAIRTKAEHNRMLFPLISLNNL